LPKENLEGERTGGSQSTPPELTLQMKVEGRVDFPYENKDVISCLCIFARISHSKPTKKLHHVKFALPVRMKA
jgi:hypothetical protein